MATEPEWAARSKSTLEGHSTGAAFAVTTNVDTTLNSKSTSDSNFGPTSLGPSTGAAFVVTTNVEVTLDSELALEGPPQLVSIQARSRLTPSKLAAGSHSKSSTSEGSKRVSASTRRNQQRLRTRNEQDQELLGKYLPNDISNIFGPPWEAPDDDDFEPPEWLLDAISDIAEKPQPPPLPPPVKFGIDTKSLQHNTNLLRENNFDLANIIDKNQHTSLAFGAEFRPIEDLQRIYHKHPLFNFFQRLHQRGMDYIYKRELTENERMAELDANIKRGNHKSATSRLEDLLSKVKRDVVYGFALPVCKSVVKFIKGAMVQPCGLAAQFTLTASGLRVLKDRLTHNLSFSITIPDASVNSRCDMSAYPAMIYGFCFLRLIHYIVALRLEYPEERILISKYNFSDAYRRVAHSAVAAAQTILIVGEIAYIMLRLSFGGSCNPPAWCAFSEMLTDLSNKIPLMKDWDPESLHSPIQETVPDPIFESDDVPIAKARPMAVSIPTTG